MITPTSLATRIISLVGMRLLKFAAVAGCLVAGCRMADDLALGRVAVAQETKLSGTLSCSATACHGNIRPNHDPSRIRGDEFVLWKENGDPHERAYRVLFGADSIQILVNLEALTRSNDPLKSTRFPGYQETGSFTTTFAGCLACHSTQIPSRFGEKAFPAARESVVGCESCHGPASGWLDVHYQSGFAELSVAEKRKFGLVDVRDIRERSRTCVECHVGAPGREVSHDWIAAGHPAMFFEQSSYIAMMPRHWRASVGDQAGATAVADKPLKEWLAGQFAVVEATAEQTRRRARNAIESESESESGSWPEYSEYACFSCHHELNPAAGWKSTRTKPSDRTVLPWSTWNLAIGEHVVSTLASNESKESLGKLRAAMESRIDSSPRDVVAAATLFLDSHVAENRAIGAPAERADDAQKLIDELGERLKASEQPISWELASQSYLALRAWSRCGTRDSKRQVEALDPLLELLSFRSEPSSQRLLLNSPKLLPSKGNEATSTPVAVRQKLLDAFQEFRSAK